eukprot:m.360232 g.360232  ORF g.360232 m.360232 type:complete len:343 (-) comp19954_c1_seq4:2233-3261(-)
MAKLTAKYLEHPDVSSVWDLDGTTVADLRPSLARPLGCDPSAIKVLFRGRPLEDNMTLAAAGLRDGVAVHVVLAPQGAGDSQSQQPSIPTPEGLARGLLDTLHRDIRSGREASAGSPLLAPLETALDEVVRAVSDLATDERAGQLEGCRQRVGQISENLRLVGQAAAMLAGASAASGAGGTTPGTARRPPQVTNMVNFSAQDSPIGVAMGGFDVDLGNLQSSTDFATAMSQVLGSAIGNLHHQHQRQHQPGRATQQSQAPSAAAAAAPTTTATTGSRRWWATSAAAGATTTTAWRRSPTTTARATPTTCRRATPAACRRATSPSSCTSGSGTSSAGSRRGRR